MLRMVMQRKCTEMLWNCAAKQRNGKVWNRYVQQRQSRAVICVAMVEYSTV